VQTRATIILWRGEELWISRGSRTASSKRRGWEGEGREEGVEEEEEVCMVVAEEKEVVVLRLLPRREEVVVVVVVEEEEGRFPPRVPLS